MTMFLLETFIKARSNSKVSLRFLAVGELINSSLLSMLYRGLLANPLHKILK